MKGSHCSTFFICLFLLSFQTISSFKVLGTPHGPLIFWLFSHRTDLFGCNVFLCTFKKMCYSSFPSSPPTRYFCSFLDPLLKAGIVCVQFLKGDPTELQPGTYSAYGRLWPPIAAYGRPWDFPHNRWGLRPWPPMAAYSRLWPFWAMADYINWCTGMTPNEI